VDLQYFEQIYPFLAAAGGFWVSLPSGEKDQEKDPVDPVNPVIHLRIRTSSIVF